MTRAERVVGAFLSSVLNGRLEYDEAVILMEDAAHYGYLTEASKDVFYAAFDEAGNNEA